MNLVDVFEKGLIKRKISRKELDDKLSESEKKGVVGGEQWFRNQNNWYSMTAYTNPYKTIYTELELMKNNANELKKLLKDKVKIFYGVGTGDTELLPVQWDLEYNNYSEVVGVDVNKEFIIGFIQSLRYLTRDYRNGRVMFKGCNNLFENTSKEVTRHTREDGKGDEEGIILHLSSQLFIVRIVISSISTISAILIE